MTKPIELTMVRTVPLFSATALLATKVENKGESATTVMPQKHKNIRSIVTDISRKIKGKSKQHTPDNSKAMEAIFLLQNVQKYSLLKHMKPLQFL